VTDAYYDPHPLLTLAQPLALVGHPGSGVAAIGRMLSGRTGLPFNDVERAAEAMVGSSRSQLAVERGIDALRDVERAAIEKALRRKPFGLIVMESGLFEDPDTHTRLVEHCRVVYVRRPEAVLLGRIRRLLAEVPGSLPEFLMGAPADAEALAAFLQPRDSVLSRIEVVLEAGDQSGSIIAGQILDSLDRLVGVERP